MKKKIRNFLIFLLLLLILAGGAVGIILYKFDIKEVKITGNTFYQENELRDQILGREDLQNTVACYLSNKFMTHKEIPYITRYQVEILDPNTVEIIVYEKNIIGYVDYMGNYMYFDYDGTIVESSNKLLPGIVGVEGVKFSKILLGEPMETETKHMFSSILIMTQLFNKYELNIDKIHFDETGIISVKVDDIKVLLGTTDFADQKISQMQDILPSLQGLKGTLYLDSVTTVASGDGVYYFVKDPVKKPTKQQTAEQTEEQKETTKQKTKKKQ